MKLFRELQVFTVCLVLLITSQDTEGSKSCSYKPNSYETCYGSSSYCCPSISYSGSYYGTTFSTCCLYNSYVSNTRYCTNTYAARLFCNAKSSHCCPSQTYMSGGYRRGCCYIPTTATESCQSVPYKTAGACYGTNTYCCPYKYYAKSYFLSTFSSCCGFLEMTAPFALCSNTYEGYWCRSPTSMCCASETYISGSWQSGCCNSSSYISGLGHRGPNVGAIVGGIVGVVVLIVIIATTVGVTCSRRNATPANRGIVMGGGVNQGAMQGYPQQTVVNGPQPAGSMPYPGYPQHGPYVTQGGYSAPGPANYHPSAPGNAAATTAGEGASAARSAPWPASGAQGGAVGGYAQARPTPEKSALPADPPPAYDNTAFSE